MKKILLLFALFFSLSAHAVQSTPIASASRAAGVTVDSVDLLARPVDKTLHLIFMPTAVTGTPTATISIDAKSPQGDYYNVITSAAIAVVNNVMTILKVGVGLTAAANTVANDMLPPVYRVRVVVGGAGGALITFSVSQNIN